MRRLSFITAALMLSSLIAGAAGPNQKFLQKAAKTVWDTKLEQFDPKADVAAVDSGASAVFIAVYENITAKMESTPFDQPSRNIYIYETAIEHYVRKMVRINDASAIESFSEFTFDPRFRIDAISGFPEIETEEAFGARIYKPDGSVVDVNMDNTLVETTGKTGKKAVKYKIAIPGLEVGDVLEYFLYYHDLYLGNQTFGTTVSVMEKYPVVSYVFDATFDPRLTVEITANNGLEIPKNYVTDSKDNIRYQFSFDYIKAFDSPRWFSRGRQMPYISIYISDNRSRLFDTAASARYSGLYVNLVAPVIMREIAEYYAEDINLPYGVVGKVNGLVNNFVKAHPDADDRMKADAAWLATIYTATTDDNPKNKYNKWKIAAIFKDVLDKQKLTTPAQLAVTSPRSSADIENIGARHRATPMVMAAGVPYIMYEYMSMAPGEMPGEYINENAFTFDGKREEVYKNNSINIVRLPKSNARQNSDTREITVTLPADLDDPVVAFDYTSTLTGAMKEVMGNIVKTPAYLRGVETYLGIPEKNRSKKKYDLKALDSSMREILEEMPLADFDITKESLKVDSAALTATGFLPDSTAMTYRVSGTIGDLVTTAGDDIIFNIGLLGGKFSDYKDLKDEREVDIIMAYPSMLKTTLTAKIPEGYYINPSDLADLGNNVNNSCGQFYNEATLTPEGDLTLHVQMRNPSIVYSYAKWGDFLAVRRAAAEFSHKSIVLHKK